MKVFRDKLSTFTLYGLITLSAVVVGMLFCLNFLCTAEVSYDGNEKVLITMAPHIGVLMGVCIAAAALILAFLWKYLDRINEKVLFRLFASVYTVMMFYLVLNTDQHTRADASQVLSAAYGVLAGDVTSFLPGGYIYKYNLQLGLMTYDMILVAIFRNSIMLFFANFFFVLGINFLTYRISDVLFNDRRVNILCIICSFAFLPQFFFILFAYGLIPGFFFLILAAYGTLLYFKESKKFAILYIVIGASLAVMFKSNYLIGIIAIAIYMCLDLLKSPKLRKGIAIAVLLLCAIVPNKLLVNTYERKLDVELGKGIPSVSWLVMGLDIDNYDRCAGWYNGRIETIYAEAGNDPEIASQITKERLNELFGKMAERPRDTYMFFWDKVKSSFCDPMFQSVWTGPLEDCGQYTYTKILKSIYNNGKAEDILMYFNKYIQMMIWTFSLVFMLLFAKKKDGWQMFFLYLIGGLLFHLLWETKSQYTYTYVFVLIPFAAYSMSRTFEFLRQKLSVMHQKLKNRTEQSS